MDLPGWQVIYEELKDQNIEIIAAAQDTGGFEAANPWYERAKATYTQLVDKNHLVSTLYNMVNVPTGVWIDEEGRIVRPNEVAYSSDVSLAVGGKRIEAKGASYVAALRDWVAKGAESAFVMSPEEMAAQLSQRTPEEATAEAAFQLGVYFHEKGNPEKAEQYWKQAQELRPDSWNYHRQDWSFTPEEASRNWLQKFQALGDDPYYEPLTLPGAQP